MSWALAFVARQSKAADESLHGRRKCQLRKLPMGAISRRGQLYHHQCWHFWHSFIHNLLRVAMPAIMIMPPAINCASNDGNKNYTTRSSYPRLPSSLCLSLPLPFAAHCCLIIYMHSCVSCVRLLSFIHSFIYSLITLNPFLNFWQEIMAEQSRFVFSLGQVNLLVHFDGFIVSFMRR